MNKGDLVSIIIPIYKSAQFIDECIRAIVDQTYKNIEVILVNDGSPDECPMKCEWWKKQDKRINVIHKENGGVSDARNVGIKQSTGKWLLFIDSDDIVPNDFVETMIKECKDPRKLVVSKVITFENEISSNDIMKGKAKYIGKDLVSERGGLYVWGALYSRSVVKNINLMFDSSLRNLEDVAWNGIYLRYVDEVVCVDVPYYYRANPNSITSRCSDSKWQIQSWLAVRKTIMNWFEDKQLTFSQKKEVKRMFRHCQNNIHAECLKGNISYVDFRKLENMVDSWYCDSFMFLIERIALNYLPCIYYLLYKTLLSIKYYIAKK